MFVFCLILAAAPPVRIDAIVMSGLSFTHTSVVETEIAYAAGDTVDEEHFALGLTRLWNTGIFAHVDGHIETSEDGTTTAYYTLRERFILAPVLNFTALTTGSYWFRLGLKDINTFGRFIDIEAAYERFNTQNGGYLAVRVPRLFGTRNQLSIRFEHLARPRPDFVHTQTRVIAQAGGLALTDRLWLQGCIDAGLSEFTPPVVGVPLLPKKTWTSALLGAIRGGRVDTVRLRQTGISAELRPMLGLVFSETHPLFAQLVAEALAFLPLGERWNFGARALAGVTSQVPPQLLFFIGGLDLVRGFVDNYLRTDLFILANVEARVVLFDGFADWAALMGVVFVDGVVARNAIGGASAAASVGVGVRLLVPKFPRSGLRVNLAQPLQLPYAVPQLSFGAFQFF